MNIASTERFGVDDFAGCRFDERWPAEKNRALIFDDDGFVAHCRDISTAGRTGTQHSGYLRNALS